MERIVTILKAVGEPTRLRILALLSRGELTVSELVQALGQSQPRVSRHLKLLAEAGVLDRLPEGAWVFYRLNDEDPTVRELVRSGVGALDAADPILRRDAERLSAVKAARAETAQAYFRLVAQDWDRIRAMHLSADQVENAMRAAGGAGPYDLHLDLGTGTGRVLELFAPVARRGVGVDLSHDMLTVARHRLESAGLTGRSVRHGDLNNLPFADGAADLVTIHQVLHYLHDPAAAIAEACRILSRHGRLVIVDFAPHSLEVLRDEHAHRRLGFADDELAGWLARAGAELEQPTALSAGEDRLTVKIWTARRTPAAPPPPPHDLGHEGAHVA